MKVIFLDHDGVICLSNNWGSRFKKRKKAKADLPADGTGLPVDLRFDNFDKKAINVLNEILSETSAEIVVSSDWKLHANLEEIGQYYSNQGIIKKPFALTPNMKDIDPEGAGLFAWKGWLERARIFEIRSFLEETPGILNWVAVDDLMMGKDSYEIHGLENFVHCAKSSEGIKQTGLKEKIVSLINS